MRVSLIKSDRIRSIDIPDLVSGNFWVTDYDENGRETNLANITAKDGKWNLLSNQEIVCVVNGAFIKEVELKKYNFYSIKKLSTNETMLIFCAPSCDENISSYYINIPEGGSITFGSNSANICHPSFDSNQAKISLDNGKFNLYALSNRYGVYINNLRVKERRTLELGDVIFINGFKFVFLRERNNFKIDINVFDNSLMISGLLPTNYIPSQNYFKESEEELNMKWYKEDDYFHKTPRFISKIEKKEIKIDAPPSKEPEPDIPIILTIGPMLTMSMSSMVMAFVSISNLKSGNSTMLSALPSIVMAVAMLASTLLWPTFTRKYENKRRLKKEKERIDKYSSYIDGRRKLILDEFNYQTNSLKRAYPNLFECNKVILERKDELWQKRIEDDDFLKVSLGYGNYPMKIKISYPEEHFSMVEDELKELSDKLSREPKILKDVPVPYSFLDNNISSVVGNYGDRSEYLKKLLLQIITFHSYADLKIVILTDNDKKSNWESIKKLPYCFSDDKKIRFFASNKEEYNDLCLYLEKIYNARREIQSKDVNPHLYDKIFLIITDSFRMVRNNDFINELLDSKENYGFSFIISNRNIASLPEQCKTFINIGLINGSLSKNIVNTEKQDFMIDLISGINYNECYKTLSNIPIETIDYSDSKIPDKLGFLEMYDVGKVEQLNSLNRWKTSNPMETLKAPVGYGKNDEIQYIDLHEKYHGPHGLVAGMTGSGKSEFIISYILSLAVNYNPLEVQFILIDYKGGGLAGAFENANSGKKLPHLVGVITNLDKSEIKRNISSIESELKRRQRLFNIARDKNGESTVDIYKYQRLFREGKVEEAVSHLFIISDEFAELKTQEPEFMDQLISTARIGRSLGVHLILATQKPSGVVDPQIWSNTRFRICLRVQDKSDSNEVIKCPDAAYLNQAGRFYFQVGYNEVFTLGQAAWAGGKYIPAEKTKKPLDTSIEFINNIGQVIKKVETKKKDINKQIKNMGEELSNIVNYLYDVAESENIKCKPLWLDKIPSFININSLISKYNFKTTKNIINIPIGEYDVPEQQSQKLLTVDFSTSGNTLLYGATGSGKENFIETLIYSAMKLYTPEEVNFYIMDFGAEILKIFSYSPYVGDVISLEEGDKIKNLFKMISSMIEQRKRLFSSFGGNYYSYIDKSGKTLPNMVIVLNNYEAYQDTYSEYDDLINTITRDCSKYGIYFIITCNTPNGMRFKLKQNFSNIYSLQQNNEDDYSTVLGNVNKSYPSKIFGRGIIKMGAVYEFQTASVNVKEKIEETIENECKKASSKYSYKARKIPTLPKVVTYNDVKKAYDATTNMVIGIEKNSLDIFKYNIRKNIINVITANDTSIMSDFSNAFLNQLKDVRGISPMVIAADDFDINQSVKQELFYEENEFNDTFEKLLKFEQDCYNLYEQNGFNKQILQNQKPIVLVIYGIESFISKLNDKNKNKISDFFTKIKDLGVINFIIFDEVENIKKVEYESWFKEEFNPNEGIWIGDGINDQFTLKPLVRTPELKESIGDEFCFALVRGKPILVKYVSQFEKDLDMIEE